MRNLTDTVKGMRATDVRRGAPITVVPAALPSTDRIPATLGDKENIVIDILKSSPPKYSHFRGGDYLHVSDLLRKCIRKIAIAERHGVQIAPERLSDSQEITFGQGSMIGDFVVNKVISGHADKVYGKWSCQCGEIVSAPGLLSSAPKHKCTTCNTAPSKYVEMVVKDEKHKLSGSIDLLLYLAKQQALHVVELKSMAADTWKELIRPIPDHVLQATFYWYLLRQAGHTVTDRVSIVYICKGWLFKLPYREFVVNPMENLHRLDDYLADALARKVAKEGGILPPRVTCSSKEVPEAKKCEMAGLCFHA